MLGAAAAATSRATLAGAAFAPPSAPAAPRFGVNYVPRKRWWFCWLDWDQQAILDDLGAVASLGVDHIRIQCLWPYFQPGMNVVSDQVLGNLHLLLDAADKNGLDVEVTVLNGWMSGFSFMPGWVTPLAGFSDRDKWNIFTSPDVIEAEKLLFRRIAETIGGHKRFLGFDIGNEMGCLQILNNPASTPAADAWATEILRYCDEIAPGKFHINGVDHTHWFNDFGFSRENIATAGHASVVHSYIGFDGVLERFKYSDPAALHLAEYEIELAYAYHADLNRRVWLEETGALPAWMPESYIPEFMEQSLRNAMSTGKLWGITWWGSHDVDHNIKAFNELEYHTGLLDHQNKLRDRGRKYAELIAEFRRSKPEAIARKTALVIADRGLSTSPDGPDWKYATPYMKLIQQGLRPAIVLESRAKDESYLKARGITELVRG